MYGKINEKIENKLLHILAKEDIIINDDTMLASFASDDSHHPPVLPEAVVFPESKNQIIEIVKLCNEEKIPITVRGGGTGVSGACIPVFGGIVLSTKKFDKILEIDKNNFCVKTEPGVVLEHLHNAVESEGLFYPPDPNSLDSCTIGGNIATSAGGPRCIKYGITRDYVLETKVILPDGNKIKYGGKFNKISTGYNLNQLIIGSEGTLGIITEIILKLIPKPIIAIDLLVPFDKFESASIIIPEILKTDFSPAIIEFIDKDAIGYSEKFLKKEFQYSKEAEAQLLIEIDGFDIEKVNSQVEKLGEYLLANGAMDVFIAEDDKTKDKIWEMRRTLREALKHIGKKKIGEDVVVPRSKISELLVKTKNIRNEIGIDIVNYGHAGDGNVHINVVKNDMEDEEWNKKSELAVIKIFELAIELGGTISGEHGIGLTKKKYLNMILNESEINFMKSIKKSIDKNLIMNPGKIFDLE